MSTVGFPEITKTIHRRKRRKSALLSLVLAIAGAIAYQAGWLEPTKQTLPNPQPGLYQVTKFDDGDTIDVNVDGTKEKIRFIGVDTPETRDPRKVVQCFGKAASLFTKELIGTNTVRLERDSLSADRDKYNRLLRYVYLSDGRLVNKELITQGYGFAYTGFPFTKSDEFVAAQALAREGNRGLWRDCQPTKNQYGGFTSNDAE